MLDEARSIMIRFKRSKDVSKTGSMLAREGYTVIDIPDDELKIQGETAYHIYVYRDDRLLVDVVYTLRNDETDYKQYIQYINY